MVSANRLCILYLRLLAGGIPSGAETLTRLVFLVASAFIDRKARSIENARRAGRIGEPPSAQHQLSGTFLDISVTVLVPTVPLMRPRTVSGGTNAKGIRSRIWRSPLPSSCAI